MMGLRKRRHRPAVLELARIELESVHIELDRLGVPRHKEDGAPLSVTARLRLYATPDNSRRPLTPESCEPRIAPKEVSVLWEHARPRGG